MEIAVATRPDAAAPRLRPVLGTSVAVEAVVGGLEHVGLRPALADLRAVDVTAAPLDLAEQAFEAVAVILRQVTDQAHAVAYVEQALDRGRRLRTAALFAEVDLGGVDPD